MNVHHDFGGQLCEHPRCRESEGWQCGECGHYFARNQVADIAGEYYCRRNAGHNAA